MVKFLRRFIETLSSIFLVANVYRAEGQECFVNPIQTDVVIIGAGMSGLAAAKTLKESGITNFKILEATDRIGGRVRSNKNFAPGSGGPNYDGSWTVEDGANWISDFKDNPMLGLIEKYELSMVKSNFIDILESTYVYDPKVYAPATKVDADVVEEALKSFEEAYYCLVEEVMWLLFESDNEDKIVKDKGILDALRIFCGWTPATPADYIAKWIAIDFEYARKDPSYIGLSDEVFWEELVYFVVDPRGYEIIPKNFAEEHRLNVDTNTKVTKVIYDNEVFPAGYSVRVEAKTSGGCVNRYITKRVISTVSTGVLENNLIQFSPSLKFPAETFNPIKPAYYIKIFYQFATKFWGETGEYINTLKKENFDGDDYCVNWQNFDFTTEDEGKLGTTANFLVGSKILQCTLLTEAYENLKESNGELSESTLDRLLDPLRQVFGNHVVIPTAKYYPKIQTEEFSGYNSYGDWMKGFTMKQYGQFFGGHEVPKIKCNHNGCNSRNEWVVNISGSASCYEKYEFVHGAYFAGERSANYVIADFAGEEVKDNGPCYPDEYYHYNTSPIDTGTSNPDGTNLAPNCVQDFGQGCKWNSCCGTTAYCDERYFSSGQCKPQRPEKAKAKIICKLGRGGVRSSRGC